ncbi:aklavinone 12-hydroxylase RdmE [Amycolatopsis sp.]|uniref:aklavinone 12-hydroxylase RdmE n=1 Tax=Amycolatopsis sp. TaxID=37632 RepID=UPI002DFAF6FB|nr:FAD-dependent monooxygenase [Amycolatopsis sp.]
MTEERTAVLVVGAGLGGLSATMFLAQHGVAVLTVERHASTAIHPRATGQNWRTMELFRWAGIDADVLDASGRASQGLRITVAPSLDGPVFHQIIEDSDDVDMSGATSMPHGMAGQEVVEPIMLARAEKFGGRVRFRTELVSFEQDADGVTALLRHRDTGEETTVRARYLVAADGGRSPVRERLGIPSTGPGIIGHNIGVVFDADLGERLKPDVTDLYYLQNPGFTAGFCNTDIPGRFVFAPDYFPEKGEKVEDFTADRLTRMIRIATDLPDLEPAIRWIGPWEIGARVASRFRDGRVFLVGDAAKVTPPTGGQGGNTAVGDGHDLAWKLAAVLRDEAGSELLDTYDAERRPIATMVVDTSLHNMKQRMRPDLDVSELTPPVDPVAGILGFRYVSSAVLAEDSGERTENPFEPSGRPGFRAPDTAIAGPGSSTVDLLGRGWVLLARSTSWRDAATDISTEIGVEISCFVAGTDFTSPDFATRYGLSDGGATLIRPDGVVAWRTPAAVEDPAGTLWNVLGQVLSR